MSTSAGGAVLEQDTVQSCTSTSAGGAVLEQDNGSTNKMEGPPSLHLVRTLEEDMEAMAAMETLDANEERRIRVSAGDSPPCPQQPAPGMEDSRQSAVYTAAKTISSWTEFVIQAQQPLDKDTRALLTTARAQLDTALSLAAKAQPSSQSRPALRTGEPSPDANDVDESFDSSKMTTRRVGASTSGRRGSIKLSSLRSVFDTFDTDGSGAMDVQEMQHMLSTAGMELSHEEALDVLTQVDDNNSGEIDFEEFVEAWLLIPEDIKNLITGKVFGAHVKIEEISAPSKAASVTANNKVAPDDSLPLANASSIVVVCYRWMDKCYIPPGSRFRLTWDMTMGLLILWYAASTPLRVAFETFVIPNEKAIEYIFTALFGLDIVLNLVTGYFEEGEIVDTQPTICRTYLGGWFWLDLAASFPYDEFSPDDSNAGSAKMAKLLRIVRIMKLVRLFKLGPLMKRLKDTMMWLTSSVWFPALKIFVMILIVWHWTACCYQFVCSNEERPEADDNAWMPPIKLDDRELEYDGSFNEQYAFAFFWAVSVTTGVGRDLPATTPIEVGFTATMVVAGLASHIIIIGKVTALLTSLDTVKTARTAKLDSVLRYCDSRAVPRTVIRRIHAYFDFLWSVDGDLEDMQIVHQLPESLQVEVAMSTFKRLIQSMPILDGISSKVTFAIVKTLTRQTHLPKDYVYYEGEEVRTSERVMYFITQGNFVAKKAGAVIETLEGGGSFGEECFLGESDVRKLTVRSLSYSETLLFDRTKFDGICVENPLASRSLANLQAASRERGKRFLSAMTKPKAKPKDAPVEPSD
jgi:hypothetical protein